MRVDPRHPRLGRAGFQATRWLSAGILRAAGFHSLDGVYGRARLEQVRAQLARGEIVYLAGLGAPGTHNSGVALVEVSAADGPRLIVNNEEERFSGTKHTTEYPALGLAAMEEALRARGRALGDVAAWLTTWDYPALFGTLMASMLDEAPGSFALLNRANTVAVDPRNLEKMTRTPKLLRRQFGLEARLPLIMMPHHDNHAWFSFAASPFDDADEPVAIAVLDGTGDRGAISLYVTRHGNMQPLFCNNSMFDSLGVFYSVVSSTQGGWTWLSSEGRYMGAAAWGEMDRARNPYYARLKDIFSYKDQGEVRLNRDLANWYRDPYTTPYSAALIDILGPPIAPADLWNPDAVLRVEDIRHRPDTQARLDKAAATQMVLEDAMIHVVDHLLRTTGANRLVLTGGVALNAVGNMRLLEHFNSAWFRAAQNRDTTLHLWVPPTPGDAGVPIGAAWRFAQLAGAGRGAPMTHAFYCGTPPRSDQIAAALDAPDVASTTVGNVSTSSGRDAIADLMAFIVAAGGVIALYQGAAETGPRALGHRSILANPCDAKVRERLNERVKFREAIRPLAPMATLEAAGRLFDLLDGAAGADYNAYNYMVLTARAKPLAREMIPAVIHADGTGRLQIVREPDDPLTYAYLKALGRRIGVEVSVNTSFNVAGPIAQTPAQAIGTLRRSKGLDVVFMVGDDGAVAAAWHGGARDSGRFTQWHAEWTAIARGDRTPA
ncbi:MAG: carbamoyltransferase C-terminal domain-containing protein [Xanthobacteraceae bacterium]